MSIAAKFTPETPEPVIRHKPSQLTPEYRKAHKNYVLIAGLLASWELIGINLNTKDKWGIELTSPKAIPLILYSLLIYSAYKMIIEWKLLEEGKPKSKPALIDYYVAHAIGVSAALIGAIQTITKVRIADYALSPSRMATSIGIAILGALSALICGDNLAEWPDRSFKESLRYTPMIIVAIFYVLPCVATIGSVLFEYMYGLRVVLVPSLIFITLAVSVGYIRGRRRLLKLKRNRIKRRQMGRGTPSSE